jgi:hypothetical protein
MKELIEKDIWDWMTAYLEVNHEFYDYKFSPCPFARKARMSGNVEVIVWEAGSYKSLIAQQLLNSDKKIKVVVFPPNFKYAWLTRYYVKNLNKKLVAQDRFIQCGNAVNTVSKYKGLSGNYTVVIINNLSELISGHAALKNTNYYDNWSKKHYSNVVTARQNIKDDYEKNN